MIDLKKIQAYYPPALHTNAFSHYLLKEYIQYIILSHLSNTKYAQTLCFIGGTNLRLVHGIDRFSEDLDFDNKNLSKDDFLKMTDNVAAFLSNSGFNVILDDKEKDNKLRAYRRNIVFPGLLFENGISPFKEEKFLIKIESQDQGVDHKPKNATIKGCGYVFNFPVPEDDVLCAMKINALIDRRKGRDFYDAMFLLSKTDPSFKFLSKRKGISNLTQLVNKLTEISDSTDLKHKARDFEHLMINKDNAKRILIFKDFILGKYPQVKINKERDEGLSM